MCWNYNSEKCLNPKSQNQNSYTTEENKREMKIYSNTTDGAVFSWPELAR